MAQPGHEHEIPLPVLTGDAVGSDPVLLRRRERRAAFLLALALVALIVPVMYLVGAVVLGRAGIVTASSRTVWRILVVLFLLSQLCEWITLAQSLKLWRGGVTKARTAFYVALATLLLWAGFVMFLVLRPRG